MSDPDPPNSPAGQLLIYQDGGTRLQVRLAPDFILLCGRFPSEISLLEDATK